MKQGQGIKSIILEVYFLLKKIFLLTTSLSISLFGVNEFYANASILRDTSNEIVNVSYIENSNTSLNLNKNSSDDTNNTISIDNSILNNSANNKSISQNELTFSYDNILTDISNYEAKIKQDEKANEKDSEISNEGIDDVAQATTTNNTYKATYTMEATAYTGGEYTAMGLRPVRDPNGLSTIAVDPAIIPLGSKVYIPGYGEAIASDTGGVINGYIVDLYLNSYDECINWGRQTVTVNILAYPGEW